MTCLRKRYNDIKNFSSLVTISHTVFAAPFALLGLFLAKTQEIPAPSFTLLHLFLIILLLILARNAAMSFNRWADVSIDSKNKRTQNRELVKKILSPKKALWFCIINAALFIAFTYFLNTLCFYLSPVALLVVLGYSYTKRFTAFCHFILGLGLALAPMGAFLSLAPVFRGYIILLSLAVLFWVAGFDMIYALQDRVFDKRNQLHSVPVLWGRRGALWCSRLCHLLTLILLYALGQQLHLRFFYWVGLIIFAALIVHQHYLVRGGRLTHINVAFFRNNGWASIAFYICASLDLFL